MDKSPELASRRNKDNEASKEALYGHGISNTLAVQGSTTSETLDDRGFESSVPISAADSDSDSPKVDASSLKPTKDIDNDGIWATIKIVHRTRVMTGKQWTIFSNWAFLFNLVINGAVYGALFVLAEMNATLPEKPNWIIYGTLVGLLIACFEVLLTLGYCLYRIKRPLPKSRMRVHVAVVLFVCVGFTIVMYMYVLSILNVFSFERGSDMPLHAAKAFLDATLLSSLVARQKFLYEVFIDSPFRASIRKWMYEITFISLVVLSGLMLIPYLMVTRNQNHSAGRWAALFTDGWCIALLCILMYYTYRTRDVKLSFNDVRSNLRVGALAVVVIVTIHVCDFYLLSPSFNPATFTVDIKPAFLLIPAMLTFGYISILATELFGLVALVTVTNLDLQDELDSRQIFTYDWCRVGSSAGGQSHSFAAGSGPLPMNFAVTGPQSISYLVTTERPAPVTRGRSDSASSVTQVSPVTQAVV